MYTNSLGRALVIGVGGQDGFLASQTLFRLGYEVIGIARRDSKRLEYLRNRQIVSSMHFIDYAAIGGLQNFIIEIKPNLIFDFTFPSGLDWRKDSSIGSLNQLLAIPKLLTDFATSEFAKEFPCRILSTSSSEIFHKDGEPKSIYDSKTSNTSYAAAKLWTLEQSAQSREKGGNFYVPIMFPHESPLRHDFFLTKKVFLGIFRLLQGDDIVIELENLSAVRDWSWAPCIVDTCISVVMNENPQSFVVGSGIPMSVQVFITTAIEALGLSSNLIDRFIENKSNFSDQILLGNYAEKSQNAHVSEEHSLKFHIQDYFTEMIRLRELGLQ